MKILLLALSLGLWNTQVPEIDPTEQQNIVFLLDSSGSMGEPMRDGNRRVEKMTVAKRAIGSVVRQLPATANVGLLIFQDEWIYPLGKLDHEKFERALSSVGTPHGTPLGRYMVVGAHALRNAMREQRYGTWRLIIVTDGENTDRSVTVKDAVPKVFGHGILINVIGVAMDKQPELKRYAGRHYYDAHDADALEQTLQRVVLAESFERPADEDHAIEVISSLDQRTAMNLVTAFTAPPETFAKSGPPNQGGASKRSPRGNGFDTSPPPQASGCGCNFSSSSGGGLPLFGLALLALAVRRRRR